MRGLRAGELYIELYSIIARHWQLWVKLQTESRNCSASLANYLVISHLVGLTAAKTTMANATTYAGPQVLPNTFHILWCKWHYYTSHSVVLVTLHRHRVIVISGAACQYRQPDLVYRWVQGFVSLQSRSLDNSFL